MAPPPSRQNQAVVAANQYSSRKYYYAIDHAGGLVEQDAVRWRKRSGEGNKGAGF